MINSDVYKIPLSNGEGLYKEKGSKFISYVFPVHSIEEVENNLEEVKKQHPKARHVCYAYRLSPNEDLWRYNDDGEPSGTAGKPIYGQILSADLHKILIAVVRYFGGTKLGASGLIQAYKLSAEDGIHQTKLGKTFLATLVRLDFDYAIMGEIMNVLKRLELDISEKNFEAKPHMILRCHQSKTEQTILKIKAMFLNRDISDVDLDTKIEGISIKIIEE